MSKPQRKSRRIEKSDAIEQVDIEPTLEGRIAAAQAAEAAFNAADEDDEEAFEAANALRRATIDALDEYRPTSTAEIVAKFAALHALVGSDRLGQMIAADMDGWVVNDLGLSSPIADALVTWRMAEEALINGAEDDDGTLCHLSCATFAELMETDPSSPADVGAKIAAYLAFESAIPDPAAEIYPNGQISTMAIHRRLRADLFRFPAPVISATLNPLLSTASLPQFRAWGAEEDRLFTLAASIPDGTPEGAAEHDRIDAMGGVFYRKMVDAPCDNLGAAIVKMEFVKQGFVDGHTVDDEKVADQVLAYLWKLAGSPSGLADDALISLGARFIELRDAIDAIDMSDEVPTSPEAVAERQRLSNESDIVYRQSRRLRAQTLEGLRVKARMADYWQPTSDTNDFEDLSWQLARSLIIDVLGDEPSYLVTHAHPTTPREVALGIPAVEAH